MKNITANVSNQVYNRLRKPKIGTYVYKAGLSNLKRAVYYSPKDDEYIIGYRGTLINDKQDIADDLAFTTKGTVKGTERYKQEREFLNHFKGKKVKLTGHSLGALYAAELGNEDKYDSYTFARPSHISDYVKRENHYDYKTQNDPIAKLNHNAEVVEQKHDNAHTILNFIDEEPEDSEIERRHKKVLDLLGT